MKLHDLKRLLMAWRKAGGTDGELVLSSADAQTLIASIFGVPVSVRDDLPPGSAYVRGYTDTD